MERAKNGLKAYRSYNILPQSIGMKSRGRAQLGMAENVRPIIQRTASQPVDPKEEYEPKEPSFNFSIVDIGSQDYITDVYQYQHIIYKQYRIKEIKTGRLEFIQRSISIKDRNMMVDLIDRFHSKFELTTNTFYRFIGIFDRYLSKQQVAKENLLVVACASLLIASKMEDVIPVQSDQILLITKGLFTKQALFNTEIQISNEIGFDTTFGTCLFFLTHFLRITDNPDVDFHYLARYILEICQSSEHFFGEKPSLMAAAAIYASNIIYGLEPWNSEYAGYTKYSAEALSSHVNWIHAMLEEPDRQETHYMRRKYGSELFHHIAHIRIPDIWK